MHRQLVIASRVKLPDGLEFERSVSRSKVDFYFKFDEYSKLDFFYSPTFYYKCIEYWLIINVLTSRGS